MYTLGLSLEGFGHILDQIFAEEMTDNNEATPVEIQHDMVRTQRYKVKQGATENFKRRSGSHHSIRLNQPIVDPEWLVLYHG